MPSENTRGAMFMALACFGFATNDACMKSLAGEVPIFQAMFVRGIMATTAVGLIGWRQGGLSLRFTPRDWRRVGVRSGAEIASAVCYLFALFQMPFANASAILQSLPLVITLAAALFLGERVGWRRYMAIGLGFLGVLLIVRPGPEGFETPALWAVAAVVFIVLRDLSTRQISHKASAQAVVFATSLALTLATGTATLTTEWQPLALSHLGTLALAASVLLFAYVFSVDTMRVGEIGFVQLFRSTLLLWAILLGIVVFGEWPDPMTLTGSAIVVATGLFTLHRETATRRQQARGA